MKITSIQTDIYWENIDGNLDQLTKIFKTIPPSDLVILPEMFTTGFTMNAQKVAEKKEDKTLSWMKKMSNHYGVMIMGSIPIIEKKHYYNRLFVVHNDQIDYYDKRHLFSMANEDQTYSSGSSSIIIEFKGWKIMPLICYDLRFPVWSRNHIKDKKYKYDILIYVANWPAKRSSAWVDLLKARAIENSCYTFGVNRVGTDGNLVHYNGQSRTFDFLGNRMDQFELDKTMIDQTICEKSKLNEFRKKFPVLQDADTFTLKY